MKTAIGLAVFLVAFSLNSQAQEIDYNKRNKHIFCASQLAVVSETLDESADQREALLYLSGMHRDEARKLGATKQHFQDVFNYLENIRISNKPKWQELSAQSKRVCLPNS